MEIQGLLMRKKGRDMKVKIVILFSILFLLLASCCYPVRYDGPYKGRVVDAETGKPIEGVVVLGVWYKEEPTVAGAVSSYYDAQERVTDKNGKFEIPGLGLKILSNVGVMNVLIFKTGYEYIGLGTWEAFKEDEILKKKIRWEGEEMIIPLKKWNLIERNKQGSPDFPAQIGGKRMKLMLEEINKDRTQRGLDPYQLGGNKL